MNGTLIKYSGKNSLNSIPRRFAYLDKKEKATTTEYINRNEGNILFMPTTVTEAHERKNGGLHYVLLLIGILQDGRKASVILTGIRPYFDVRKPDSMNAKEFDEYMENAMTDLASGATYEMTEARGFTQYEKHATPYARIYFNNVLPGYDGMGRKDAMKYFENDIGMETASNDLNHYERLVCRTNDFTMCGWNEIKQYDSYKHDPLCKLSKTFRVQLHNFVQYKDDIIGNEQLSNDKTMVETWDIETYSPESRLPDGQNKEDVVFVIGKTYHWRYSRDAILKVCLVCGPCDPHPDYLTITCTSQKKLILASFELTNIMRPDYIVGFNDGSYDWPFLIEKMDYYKIFHTVKNTITLFNKYEKKGMTDSERNYNIRRWDCVNHTIKLGSQTEAYSESLEVAGIINIDARTICRQSNPKAVKTSLSYFLKKYNMAGKDDMPINELFRIYRESDLIKKDILNIRTSQSSNVKSVKDRLTQNKKDMCRVAHYCMIDAFRCQELILKINAINDKREVSHISHTSLYDAIFFADGMKVRNLIMADGNARGLRFSSRTKEFTGHSKYTGAYVFPPDKGVVKPKLTVRERKEILDDWKNVTDAELSEMERAVLEDDVPDVSEESNNLYETFMAEETMYPISGLDYSSLYPSVIMAFNFSPEMLLLTESAMQEAVADGHTVHKICFEFEEKEIKAWCIRHDTIDGKTLQKGKTVAKFGLYPTILAGLFADRQKLKNRLKPVVKKKEIMEAKGDIHSDEYKKLCFLYVYLNTKQKALKVFMNTFYGETGNKLSPIFVLVIAGGITFEGQRNIRRVSNIVTSDGCDIVAETGDVDSSGCRLYYGDSVAHDTPVLVKIKNKLSIITICELFEMGDITPYPQFKPGQGVNKEQAMCCAEIWTGCEWSKINRVIRHNTTKKMFRVRTTSGIVDVTEDHSLLDQKNNQIKPAQLHEGSMLMASFPPRVVNMTVDVKDYTEIGRDCAIGGNTDLRGLINGPSSSMCSFLRGFFSIADRKISKVMYQTVYFMLYNTGLLNVKTPGCVVGVDPLGCTTGYVYDIETTAGRFHCGIGDLIVKNTDSVYISCPRRHFAEYDRQYYGGKISKIDYCTNLVKETFKRIQVVKDIVNQKNFEDNGTRFLNVAYEEVLYPCLFLKKKMYAGVKHEKQINFYPAPSTLFIKGLVTERRDSPEILKKSAIKTLMRILSIDETLDVMNIVKDAIREVYESKWDIADFKKSSQYRPYKKNASVIRFMDRMRERNDPRCPVPEAGERFEYVIVNKYPFTYDIRGIKTILKKSDKWEYYTYAKENKLEVDLNSYITGGVVGQFAQLVAYPPFFGKHVEPEYQESEDAQAMKHARKFIENLCKKYHNAPVCEGPRRKKMYRAAIAAYGKNTKYKIVSVTSAAQSATHLYEKLVDNANKAAEKTSNEFGRAFVAHMTKTYGNVLSKVAASFSENKSSFSTYMLAMSDTRREKARLLYAQHAQEISAMISKRDDAIQDFLSKASTDMHIDIDEKIMGLVQSTYDTLLVECQIRQNIVSAAKWIRFKTERRDSLPPTINIGDVKQSILDLVAQNPLDF